MIPPSPQIDPSELEAARRFLLDGRDDEPRARPTRTPRSFAPVSHGITRARGRAVVPKGEG